MSAPSQRGYLRSSVDQRQSFRGEMAIPIGRLTDHASKYLYRYTFWHCRKSSLGKNQYFKFYGNKSTRIVLMVMRHEYLRIRVGTSLESSTALDVQNAPVQSQKACFYFSKTVHSSPIVRFVKPKPRNCKCILFS